MAIDIEGRRRFLAQTKQSIASMQQGGVGNANMNALAAMVVDVELVGLEILEELRSHHTEEKLKWAREAGEKSAR